MWCISILHNKTGKKRKYIFWYGFNVWVMSILGILFKSSPSYNCLGFPISDTLYLFETEIKEKENIMGLFCVFKCVGVPISKILFFSPKQKIKKKRIKWGFWVFLNLVWCKMFSGMLKCLSTIRMFMRRLSFKIWTFCYIMWVIVSC